MPYSHLMRTILLYRIQKKTANRCLPFSLVARPRIVRGTVCLCIPLAELLCPQGKNFCVKQKAAVLRTAFFLYLSCFAQTSLARITGYKKRQLIAVFLFSLVARPRIVRGTVCLCIPLAELLCPQGKKFCVKQKVAVLRTAFFLYLFCFAQTSLARITGYKKRQLIAVFLFPL